MSAAACASPRVGMLTFSELAGPAGAGAGEPAVDAQLWLACAGSMCTVPLVGAAVYYFPQGHAEQAKAAVDLSSARVPALVPCRVVAVRFMADPQSDEVFAKMRLVPLRHGEAIVDVGEAANEAMRGGAGDEQTKPASFAKTLTQSDANNGGGFSVPRFCAETIFPELDYRAEPPVQYVYAKDVHGVEWKFRHIYRGTPRRHLLTTGWSNFVNQKKLLAGDSIVFLRGEGGQVHVGIRRAKRGFCIDGGEESPSWDHYRGLVRGHASSSGGDAYTNGKVPAEDVVAAARLAAAGQPFEVVHYPRASSPEFCVRAAAVTAAMHVQWCPGMRFKMAFETEDSSRISWFMGTIAGVQAAEPVRWPQSPWRLLEVTWDEPELLQNVKRVCPWLVELVSSMPNLHLPSFSPPRKKPRIPPCTELPFEGRQLFDPAFPPNYPLPLAPHPHPHHDQNHRGSVPFFPFPDSSAAAGIQGARHAQFAPSFSDLHISNLHHSSLFSSIRFPADHHAPRPPRISTDLTIDSPPAHQDAPCSLSSGAKKPDEVKPQGLVLFGRAILTEEQIKGTNSSVVPASAGAAGNGSSKSDCDAEKAPNTSEGSGSGVIQGSPTKNNSSPWILQWFGDNGSRTSEFGLEPGQCKVFIESDAVGRNLDLSALGSFENLYTRLSDMFCIESTELKSHVLYRTAAGEVKHVGDEPFSAFVKSARRITILTDAGSDNIRS
ncbi:auxin response factor 10-like [Phragmites australis]|uniref:auxin response factor 10-like n=1 Tax=Phragmites australis TaxID=29695 RepID=UPI002D79BE79|nr:auxin response factor 10-like [Phragmites australis]